VATSVINANPRGYAKDPTFIEAKAKVQQISDQLEKVRNRANTEALPDTLAAPDTPPAANAAPVKISTNEEWAKLAPGTQFIAPDGTTRTK
jgi:hypothetical protein